jgi:hypothetical protein
MKASMRRRLEFHDKRAFIENSDRYTGSQSSKQCFVPQLAKTDQVMNAHHVCGVQQSINILENPKFSFGFSRTTYIYAVSSYNGYQTN